MHLVLQHSNLRLTDRLDALITQSLTGLLPLIRIETAQVRVEFRPEASPAYRASAHLMIPGPDVKVEADGHTPETAFAKIFAMIKLRAVERASRRIRRHLGRAPVPTVLRAGHGSRR